MMTPATDYDQSWAELILELQYEYACVFLSYVDTHCKAQGDGQEREPVNV